MVSKDQAIGGIICTICVAVGILYTAGMFVIDPSIYSTWKLPFWLIAIPVFIAFIAIMGIGAWIGWTMATTPPPKPIEDITSEMEAEEKKEPEKETTEETAEEPKPEKVEEKKPERKKKPEA